MMETTEEYYPFRYRSTPPFRRRYTPPFRSRSTPPFRSRSTPPEEETVLYDFFYFLFALIPLCIIILVLRKQRILRDRQRLRDRRQHLAFIGANPKRQDEANQQPDTSSDVEQPQPIVPKVKENRHKNPKRQKMEKTVSLKELSTEQDKPILRVPMKEIDPVMCTIQRNYGELLAMMKPDETLIGLFQKGVFNLKMKQEVNALNTAYDKNAYILDHIIQYRGEVFEQFHDVITETKQLSIVTLIGAKTVEV